MRKNPKTSERRRLTETSPKAPGGGRSPVYDKPPISKLPPVELARFHLPGLVMVDETIIIYDSPKPKTRPTEDVHQ